MSGGARVKLGIPANVSIPEVNFNFSTLETLECSTNSNLIYDNNGLLQNVAFSRRFLVSIWLILATFIVVGNATVVMWRCFQGKRRKMSIPSLLVINLALGDFLLGVQMLIYLYILRWSCSTLSKPQYVTVMTALCKLSGILEGTSVIVSGMLTATIALYYAVAVFTKVWCFDVDNCSKRKMYIFLLIEWTAAIGAGVTMALFYVSTTIYEDPSYRSKVVTPFYQALPQPLYISDTEGRLESTNTTIAVVQSSSCVPLIASASKVYSPLAATSLAVYIAVFCLTVLGGVTYIVVLVRIRIAKSLAANTVAFGALGVRLSIIAFVTIGCWVTSMTVAFGPTNRALINHYIGLLAFAVIATCNPLIFTIFSKLFWSHVKRL